MKKSHFYSYIVLLMAFALVVSRCNDSNQENILTQLKENGKINTFSLTLIVSDKLNDSSFASIKELCSYSGENCKTLPDAGILRLGPNMYFPYNSISELTIPESIEDNEEAISKTVQEQVNVYFSTTKPKDYDSLLAANHTDWDNESLVLNYISKMPSDSVLFYSHTLEFTSLSINNKSYTVYTSTSDLRKKIDELVCQGYGSVSVFFNPPVSLGTPGTARPKVYIAKGTPAGDTCIGFSKFERVHDGFGAFMAGRLLEANSKDCGGSTVPEKVTTVPKDRPTKENKAVIEKSTPSERASPRVKINETETETEIIKNNSSTKGKNRCASKSDPLCETDASGNYTGRRVQYCYDNKGNILQTIVLAKCDSDCRCF